MDDFSVDPVKSNGFGLAPNVANFVAPRKRVSHKKNYFWQKLIYIKIIAKNVGNAFNFCNYFIIIIFHTHAHITANVVDVSNDCAAPQL